jgi:hypothetical protein
MGFMLTKDGSGEKYWTPVKAVILDIEGQLKVHT